jgi:hypothetical protein
MDALSIAVAFLAIMTPCAVVFGGIKGIKWLASRREFKIKAEQDREMREHDERLAAMRRLQAVQSVDIRMANRPSMESADKIKEAIKKAGLRAVPNKQR